MRVILAGGGSGGHIIPGITLANQLRKIYNIKPFFLCTKKRIDVSLLKSADIPFISLPILNIKNPVILLVNFTTSLILAIKTLMSLKPRIVIGLGGYGSFVPVLSAYILNIPAFVLEQNVIPGLANRVLQFFVKKIYSQWGEARRYFGGADGRFQFLGPVLRDFQVWRKQEALREIGLSLDKKTILVHGGSQGAEWINKMLLQEIHYFQHIRDKIQFIHLTGGKLTQELEASYKKAGLQCYLQEFSNRMDIIYSASDIAISRAGAITLAELLYFNIPAILIPYSHSRDNHQMHNAKIFAKMTSAIIFEQRDYAPGKIFCILQKRLLNKQKIAFAGVKNALPEIVQDLERYLCHKNIIL